MTNTVGNDTDSKGLGSAEFVGRLRSVPAFDESIVSGIAATMSDGRGVVDRIVQITDIAH